VTRSKRGKDFLTPNVEGEHVMEIVPNKSRRDVLHQRRELKCAKGVQQDRCYGLWSARVLVFSHQKKSRLDGRCFQPLYICL
jgi:hypothetical protein